jgi:hypothetical protein
MPGGTSSEESERHSQSGAGAVGSGICWDANIDRMLASWCDEAKCYEWMHGQAYSEFDRKARAIMIASNVLTAVAGLSNVIAGDKDINGFQLSWFFGSLSIIVSITNMLQEKLAYAASAAEHHQHSIQWAAIRRKIEEQVAIPWENRKDCATYLKYLRQDVTAASSGGVAAKIPVIIRDACKAKFGSIPDFDIPDICGTVKHTKTYVPPVALTSDVVVSIV